MFELAKAKIKEYGQRYRIDLAYVIKNEFWVYLRQGISLIISLAVPIAFARLAPKEVYGQYNFILAILAIASLLSIPGLNQAVVRSTARGYEGSYKQAVKTSFLWSLLGIPALLGVGAYYYYYSTQIIGICLMMSSIFFPFIYAPNIWDSFLTGKKRFDVAARYGIIQAATNAAAIIGILFLNADRLVLILAAYLITSSLMACLLYRQSLRYIENNARDDECQKYGYFLTTTNIVGTLATNIDRILIGILLGAPELAIYAIAIAIPTRIKDLQKFVWAPFMPKISEQGTRMREAVAKGKGLILPLALIIAGASLLYWLFVDDIILLLFSPKYVEAGVYSRMLLFMILFSIPATFLAAFTIARKKTKSIVLGYLVFPFVKLAIMFGFIYQWGVWGAVWGLNLSMLVQSLLIWAGIGSGEWSQE
jgi:O-antigen/teichoic acid export membrane protein